MSTNITAAHKEAFEALASGRFGNFALFSCFVNGEPATAIVAGPRRRYVRHHPSLCERDPDMTLTDHDGREPEDLAPAAAS